MPKSKKNKGQAVRVTVSFAVNKNPFDRQLWNLLNDNDQVFLNQYSLESTDSISIRLKRIALSVINNEFSNGSHKGVEKTETKEPIPITNKEKKSQIQTVNTKPSKKNLLNPLDEAVTINLDDLA